MVIPETLGTWGSGMRRLKDLANGKQGLGAADLFVYNVRKLELPHLSADKVIQLVIKDLECRCGSEHCPAMHESMPSNGLFSSPQIVSVVKEEGCAQRMSLCKSMTAMQCVQTPEHNLHVNYDINHKWTRNFTYAVGE